MRHEDIVEKLSEFRDGALGASERDAVARHLAGCADCSAFLADLERLSKALLRRPPAPNAFQTEAFVARVMGRLPAPADPLAWLTAKWLVPALGVGFAALALSFRPYSGRATVDTTSSLLLGGAPAAAASATPVADALGLGAEDR